MMSNNQEITQDVADNTLHIIREGFVLLAGTTGIFVGLLWLLGRNYQRGYYDTANIPLFQINLSIWEYGEMGWQILIIGAYLAGFAVLFLIVTRLPRNRQVLPNLVKFIIWILCITFPHVAR